MYFCICDIKYDPRLPSKERVRVLELGDGQYSQFSAHGAAIKEKFAREYCMDPSPLKRALLVENKKVTHDRFVREGFAHLRPPCGCYERRYAPDLAGRVREELGLSGESFVVLKLCNRSRGAGVVVTPAGKLDEVLRQLLVPPCGKELDKFLTERIADALGEAPLEAVEEQCLHWWSNECPVFIAERCCHSVPVSMPSMPEHVFDGTMRVAFVLRRPGPAGAAAGGGGAGGGDKVESFVVECLGGYWKLPPAPTAPGDGRAETLEQTRAKIVSSFNSSEKRTAEVPRRQLDEVCAALRPALPLVFRAGTLEVPSLIREYEGEARLFCGFIVARAAAAIRIRRMDEARLVLEQARAILGTRDVGPEDADSLPERAVSSYIHRNLGICSLMSGKLGEAGPLVQKAVRTHPTNSTAYYIEGCFCEEQRRHEKAVVCMLRSIALDPDFKLPYIALGGLQLQLEDYGEAFRASRACLRRHPDSPAAMFNLGQALYHMSLDGDLPAPGALDGTTDWRSRALEALSFAKARVPEQWSHADEQMLEYFKADPLRRKEFARQKVHLWKVQGWRP